MGRDGVAAGALNLWGTLVWRLQGLTSALTNRVELEWHTPSSISVTPFTCSQELRKRG